MNSIRCRPFMLCKPVVIWALCLSPHFAYAGPEPDAGYKLWISAIASLALIFAHCCAVGFLGRFLGRSYWIWCIVQLAAWSVGIVLFLWTLGSWFSPPDMSVLDILLTDLIFETWSLTNVLLFASALVISGPIILLSLLHVISRNRS